MFKTALALIMLDSTVRPPLQKLQLYQFVLDQWHEFTSKFPTLNSVLLTEHGARFAIINVDTHRVPQINLHIQNFRLHFLCSLKDDIVSRWFANE